MLWSWIGEADSYPGGILSQGLRIAPPEAPVNGYAFGKGVCTYAVEWIPEMRSVLILLDTIRSCRRLDQVSKLLRQF